MKNRTLCLALMALMVGMGMTGTAFAQCSAQNAGPACVDVVTNINGGTVDNEEVPQGVQSGSYGMRVRAFDGDNSETYVQIGAAAGVNQEQFFRAGFWINTDDFDTTVHGARHFIVTTVGPAQTRPMRTMYIRNKNQNKHQIRGICQRNCAGGPSTACPNAGTGTLDLGNGWNFVQMSFGINTQPAPAPADGTCKLEILSGGSGSTEVVSRYSQYDVRQVRLGMTGGANIHPSTQGAMYFDDFAAFRTLAP